jgi:hypothetical protein
VPTLTARILESLAALLVVCPVVQHASEIVTEVVYSRSRGVQCGLPSISRNATHVIGKFANSLWLPAPRFDLSCALVGVRAGSPRG